MVAQLNEGGEEPIKVPGYYRENPATYEIPAWQPSYLKSWTLNTMVAHEMNYHELIHQIKMPGGDTQNPPLIGFMVNDEEDSHDTPDMLYLSDGYYSLAVLKSVDADGTMNFEYAWNIKAGVAYLIKPECTVENPVLEYKGNLKLAPEPIPTDIDGYNYIGIYSPRTWTGVDEWYFGVKTSQLIKVKQSLVGQNLNGFRAFFLLPSGQSARLSIYGVVTTGIDELESPIATHRLLPDQWKAYSLQDACCLTNGRPIAYKTSQRT